MDHDQILAATKHLLLDDGLPRLRVRVRADAGDVTRIFKPIYLTIAMLAGLRGSIDPYMRHLPDPADIDAAALLSVAREILNAPAATAAIKKRQSELERTL